MLLFFFLKENGDNQINMHYSVSFSRLQEDFEELHLDCGASEAHGILCGMLSINADNGEDAWIRELLSRSILLTRDSAQEEPLRVLGRETRSALIDKSDLFHPLLPDDDRPISERAAGLRDWSVGFLYGVGLNRNASDDALSTEASEALRDLAEISRMETEDIADDDEDEEIHLNEVSEYVRVVAALLVDELQNTAQEKKH